MICSNDYSPSLDTPLQLFVQFPLKFIETCQKLPIHIVVEKANDRKIIDFHASEDMNVSRIRKIICEFLRLKEEFYDVFYDGTELDDLSLNDISFPANDHLQEDQTMPNEFILEIVARAPLKTCVIHGENRITVPSNGNTILREVITEAIDSMNIEEKDPSNLKIFGDLDRQT